MIDWSVKEVVTEWLLCTGAAVGLAGLEPPAADELAEGRGAARTRPAHPDRAGLSPGHLLLLTHHGPLPQGVCLQSGPGNGIHTLSKRGVHVCVCDSDSEGPHVGASCLSFTAIDSAGIKRVG